MAIGMAQQKGSQVYVYDERNHQIYSKTGELHGYTSTTVTIRKGSTLYMYDDHGRQTGSRN